MCQAGVRHFCLSLLLGLLLGLPHPTPVAASVLCPDPIWVHEWGVLRFDAQGNPRGHRATAPTLPDWFHQRTTTVTRPPVRHLPSDSGRRDLPVLHFYARPEREAISVPIRIGVGFQQGRASSWYPQVNGRRIGGGPFLSQGGAPQTVPPTLQQDAAYQLFWDALTLTRVPTHSHHQASAQWVRDARAFGSLWANTAQQSERFVFYEAETTERPAVRIDWQADRNGRRVRLHNTSPHPVHDIFLTHWAGGQHHQIQIDTLPAGVHVTRPLRRRAGSHGQLRTELRNRLIDPQERTVPRGVDPNRPCRLSPEDMERPSPVAHRDAAAPQEGTEGHRLFEHEVDLLLDLWAPFFFPTQGTTLVYREDTQSLDSAMPLALFTDVNHYFRLRRLGLVVQQLDVP